MPTVLRIGPYRFFFYAGDREEPPHIHVEREDFQAKFWLAPVRFQTNRGFKSWEVKRIENLVEENQESLMESWEGFFSD
jgi:hypothetical protein